MNSIEFSSNSSINTGVDLLLHGVILFVFLSTFFLLYVSKLSKQTLSNELPS